MVWGMHAPLRAGVDVITVMPSSTRNATVVVASIQAQR